MGSQSRFDKILITVLGVIVPFFYIATALGIDIFVPLDINLEQNTLNIISMYFLVPNLGLFIYPWSRFWDRFSKRRSHQVELLIGLVFESNLSITGLILFLLGQPIVIMIILTIISSAGTILWGVRYAKNKSTAA